MIWWFRGRTGCYWIFWILGRNRFYLRGTERLTDVYLMQLILMRKIYLWKPACRLRIRVGNIWYFVEFIHTLISVDYPFVWESALQTAACVYLGTVHCLVYWHILWKITAYTWTDFVVFNIPLLSPESSLSFSTARATAITWRGKPSYEVYVETSQPLNSLLATWNMVPQ